MEMGAASGSVSYGSISAPQKHSLYEVLVEKKSAQPILVEVWFPGT